jgi:hypothetical protein
MTVSCDPNDEICKLRIIVGDAEEPYLLDDAVYQYFLDTSDSFGEAVIKAIEACLATVSKYVDERTDEVEVKWSQLYDNFRRRYDDLLRDPSQAVFVSLHKFGGTTNSEICSIRNNPETNGSPIQQGSWNSGLQSFGCYNEGDCY